jgi:uncharacterized protein YbjT (DUF2867 family)
MGLKLVIFGATGMVGQGALRECLLSPEVESVLAVGRAATGQKHEKLREIVLADVQDLSGVRDQLSGRDACFFCLGVSSAGMAEATYRRLTYDLTLAVARTLVEQSPGMTFIYVSGAGTDGSAGGRSMWARVKGETENALLALPFRAAYMFRPGYIQPLHGVRSKTRLYRAVYAVFAPLYPLLRRIFPRYVTTSEDVARAMIEIARHGSPRPVIENRDIAELARAR